MAILVGISVFTAVVSLTVLTVAASTETTGVLSGIKISVLVATGMSEILLGPDVSAATTASVVADVVELSCTEEASEALTVEDTGAPVTVGDSIGLAALLVTAEEVSAETGALVVSVFTASVDTGALLVGIAGTSVETLGVTAELASIGTDVLMVEADASPGATGALALASDMASVRTEATTDELSFKAT